MQSSSDRIKLSDIELRQNKLPRKKLLTKRKRSGKISNVAAETQKQRSLRDTGSQGIIQTIRGRNQKDEKST